MPLAGSLSTMSLPDLLQWLSAAKKTGTLQVERDKVAKWIRLEEGRIVGCSSDDPPQRLGQYLLYQEKITEEQLREALTAQERSGEFLGQTLVDLGLVSAADLTGHLESNAEETLYSLFDWADGVFRFDETDGERDQPFPLMLRVEDVLLRGLKRFDDMRRIREVFPDPNTVLRYTSKPPGPEIFGDRAARTMYLTIDGERTIAEIVLHLHGCEYTVQKFLFDLHRDGYVEVSHAKPVRASQAAPTPAPPATPRVSEQAPDPPPRTATLTDGSRRPTSAMMVADPVTTEAVAAVDLAPGPVASAALDDLETLEELTLDDAVLEPNPPEPAAPAPAKPSGELGERLKAAGRLLDDGQLEAALDALDELYRLHPTDDALRRLQAEAEATFVDRTYRHAVPKSKIPVLLRSMEDLASESLSPQEFFMLSRIDGVWDVKSIIQVAPLREVEALRTLKRMRELEMIEFRDPD